jgi:HEAT repeat protein
VDALGEIGPPAKPAVPELLKALSHRELNVRRAAAEALKTIDPTAVPK